MQEVITEKKNLGYEECVEKYPDVSRFMILKVDTALRDITLTENALARARETGSLFDIPSQSRFQKNKSILGGVIFKDGTLAEGLESLQHLNLREMIKRGTSYILDVVDDRLMLLDGEEPVEECYFVPTPDYYTKKTSRGTPMFEVVQANPPECLFINAVGYCYFWKDKVPCRYCSIPLNWSNRDLHSHEALRDLHETINEALKEAGRWNSIRIDSGSEPTGNYPYEKEINEFTKILKTLKSIFGKKFASIRLVASAFPTDRLYGLKESGATAYEPHIEVWDEKLFEWICPGKAKYFGRQYWIDNAIAAVEVFGEGNVCTQIVGGAEMSQPYGFKTIDEAVKSSLEGAEFFARNGVTMTSNILGIGQGSVLYGQKQQPPPLEYFVKLNQGLRNIRKRYGLIVDFNDYRRCGRHPDTVLSRLDYNVGG